MEKLKNYNFKRLKISHLDPVVEQWLYLIIHYQYRQAELESKYFSYNNIIFLV